ncbi:MAG: hypothetical protein AAGG02_17655 [Cyanobacteria bacterium P01_H01_bin.15]
MIRSSCKPTALAPDDDLLEKLLALNLELADKEKRGEPVIGPRNPTQSNQPFQRAIMSATVNLQISLDTLIQAMSALDLQAKHQLLEIIEQQVFEAEEAEYQEDAVTKTEIEAVQLEYSQGEYMTIDEFVEAEAT